MPAANQTRPRPEAWRRVTPPSPHGGTDRDRAPGRLPLRQPQPSPPCCWVPREPKGCAEPAGPWHSAWAGLQGRWSLRLLPGRQGRPPGPALPCAPFPAQLVCWQLGAPPSQGGANPRDEEASLGSQRLRGRPGAPWPPGWEALQPDLGERGLKEAWSPESLEGKGQSARPHRPRFGGLCGGEGGCQERPSRHLQPR